VTCEHREHLRSDGASASPPGADGCGAQPHGGTDVPANGMGERAHLSIGEVLSLLQDEHPDVTISKIRFLESQGLLDPERTPSGYRKFYEGDIERLRWILHQQRENFLPLKVIKDRLSEADALGLSVPDARQAPIEDAVPIRDELPIEDAVPAPASASVATSEPTTPARRAATHKRAAANPLDAGPTAASFTLDELADAAGLDPSQLRELERYGLLESKPMGSDAYYDGDALIVARTAAGFLRFGIEARHLRMYKIAAEREAGFFEQVITPLLKQRNPASRQQAVGALGDLARLGEAMRTALLRAALRAHSPR
jgi:DNA-binding transcriptional MerR regulator